MTVIGGRCLNAYDRIPYTAHVSDLTARKQTKQSPVTSTILDSEHWPLLLNCLATSAEPTHRTITPGHSNLHQPSTRGLATSERSSSPVLAADNQGRHEDSEHWPLLSLTYCTETITLTSSRKQLHSGRGEPPDDDDVHTILPEKTAGPNTKLSGPLYGQIHNTAS